MLQFDCSNFFLSSQGKFLYDVNQKVIDVYTAVCTARHQPEMLKSSEPCSTVGADARTSGLDQLFLGKITWNVQGKIYSQVRIFLLFVRNKSALNVAVCRHVAFYRLMLLYALF